MKTKFLATVSTLVATLAFTTPVVTKAQTILTWQLAPAVLTFPVGSYKAAISYAAAMPGVRFIKRSGQADTQVLFYEATGRGSLPTQTYHSFVVPGLPVKPVTYMIANSLWSFQCSDTLSGAPIPGVVCQPNLGASDMAATDWYVTQR
jgi:hypothetical protein